MKQWAIVAAVIVGGYVSYKWWQSTRQSAGASNTSSWDAAHLVQNVFGPLQSGVPSYNDTAVLNRPDQIAASQTDNMYATLPGGGEYIPAFGPTENR